MGKDLTSTLNFFGRANSKIIADDFSNLEKKKFSITKEILWESDSSTDKIVN